MKYSKVLLNHYFQKVYSIQIHTMCNNDQFTDKVWRIAVDHDVNINNENIWSNRVVAIYKKNMYFKIDDYYHDYLNKNLKINRNNSNVNDSEVTLEEYESSNSLDFEDISMEDGSYNIVFSMPDPKSPGNKKKLLEYNLSFHSGDKKSSKTSELSKKKYIKLFDTRKYFEGGGDYFSKDIETNETSNKNIKDVSDIPHQPKSRKSEVSESFTTKHISWLSPESEDKKETSLQTKSYLTKNFSTSSKVSTSNLNKYIAYRYNPTTTSSRNTSRDIKSSQCTISTMKRKGSPNSVSLSKYEARSIPHYARSSAFRKNSYYYKAKRMKACISPNNVSFDGFSDSSMKESKADSLSSKQYLIRTEPNLDSISGDITMSLENSSSHSKMKKKSITSEDTISVKDLLDENLEESDTTFVTPLSNDKGEVRKSESVSHSESVCDDAGSAKSLSSNGLIEFDNVPIVSISSNSPDKQELMFSQSSESDGRIYRLKRSPEDTKKTIRSKIPIPLRKTDRSYERKENLTTMEVQVDESIINDDSNAVIKKAEQREDTPSPGSLSTSDLCKGILYRYHLPLSFYPFVYDEGLDFDAFKIRSEYGRRTMLALPDNNE